MIIQYPDNFSKRIWIGILEYANVAFSEGRLESLHGLRNHNTRKQAKQIRSCILQAKDYFDASESASLITRPTQLYYGVVALSSALMLLHGTGDHSLDKLREKEENRKHGIRFSGDIKALLRSETPFAHVFATLERTGFFRNFYETYPAPAIHYPLKFRREDSSINVGWSEVASGSKTPYDDLRPKISLADLVARLPDLHQFLERAKIPSNSLRGDIWLAYDEGCLNHFMTYDFGFIPSKPIWSGLLSTVQAPHPHGVISRYDDQTQSGSIRLDIRRESAETFSFPDSRSTIDGDEIVFASEVDTPEIMDWLRATYVLSMLSRYYPDIWVEFLESHSIFSKVIENLVEACHVKYPKLVLECLLEERISVPFRKLGLDPSN